MRTEEIINICLAHGITLWVEEGKLKYRCRSGTLKADLLSEIRKNKFELIRYLEEENSKYIELTPIQSAYFIGSNEGYELGNIHAQYYAEYIHEDIDISKMEAAINKVIEMNEILRTVVRKDGYIKSLTSVPRYILTFKTVKDDNELLQTRKKLFEHKFIYEKWPLLYFFVSKRMNRPDIFHVGFDCIILDAWSAKKMMEDIFSEYFNQEVMYSEHTFAEYFEKSKEVLKDKTTIINGEKYWRERIKTLPAPPDLPYKTAFCNIRTPHFKRLEHSFSQGDTFLMYQNIGKTKYTPAAIICTAYMKTLATYSKNQKFTLNLTLFNRNQVFNDVNEILGDFTNLGFVEYSSKTDFWDTVFETQKQFWKLLQYREYNGLNVLKRLGENEPVGKAIMPVVFTGIIQGTCSSNIEKNGFKEIYSLSQTPQVVLDHQARDDRGYLYLSWDYVEEAFEEELIKNMFNEYIKCIIDLINNNI